MLSSRKEILNKLADNISQYSPILVRGEAGIGKSFFLNELCQKLKERGKISEYEIRYSWDILDDLICSLADRNMEKWKQDLLSSQVIVIDDFQYLKEKVVIAEELYKIFCAAHVPSVIATTIPINQENFYSKDMVQFFNEGTNIQLDFLDCDDVIGILNRQIKLKDLHLSPQAYIWLAQQNITTLAMVKGIVKTLHLHRNSDDHYITLSECQQLITPLILIEKEKK